MSEALIENGAIEFVYDDRWTPILAAVGRFHVERATRVEWDEDTQQWVATHIATGREIARGRNRSAVIAEEVRVLNRELLRRMR